MVDRLLGRTSVGSTYNTVTGGTGTNLEIKVVQGVESVHETTETWLDKRFEGIMTGELASGVGAIKVLQEVVEERCLFETV